MTIAERMEEVSLALCRHLTSLGSARSPLRLVQPSGPITKSISNFEVAIAEHANGDGTRIYASIGAWRVPMPGDERLEFVITSPVEDPIHIETLAMVAHYHADPRYGVCEGKILDIGRPWMESSHCTQLLVSLPYPFGRTFENCQVNATRVRFLWLLPITPAEAAYGKHYGVPALEEIFERESIDTLDVMRASVV